MSRLRLADREGQSRELGRLVKKPMATAVRENDIDSLANLEERISKAVEVVARLRSEKEALQSQLDAACRASAMPLYRKPPPRTSVAENRPGTRRASQRTQTGSHENRKAARTNGSSEHELTYVQHGTVRVTIFNQTYTVLALKGPNDIQELAQLVDQLMYTIARAGNYDPQGPR